MSAQDDVLDGRCDLELKLFELLDLAALWAAQGVNFLRNGDDAGAHWDSVYTLVDQAALVKQALIAQRANDELNEPLRSYMLERVQTRLQWEAQS